MNEVKNDISGNSTLIKRLTKGEKAYITSKLKRSKGNELHKVLFDLICKSRADNELEIKKEFQHNTASPNYTLIKSQLFDFILTALSDINNSTASEYHFFKSLEQASILSSKQLHQQGIKIAHQVLKQAERLDYFALQSKSLELIIEIAIKLKSLNDIQFGIEGLKKLKLDEILYNEILQYTHEANMTFFTKSGKPEFEKEFKTIKAKIKAPISNSKKVLTAYNHLKGFIELVFECNYDKAAEYFKRNYELLSTDETYLKTHMHAYQTAVYNLSICYDNHNNEKEFFRLLDEQERLKQKAGLESPEDFGYTLVVKQSFYQIRNKRKEAIALTEKQEIKIKQLENSIPSGILLVIYTNVVFSSIYVSDWKKALKWNNFILTGKFDHSPDLVAVSKLTNLLVHYELKNTDLIESLLPGVRRSLVSGDHYHGYFKAVYDFFNTMIHDYEGIREKSALQKLKTELVEKTNNPTFNLEEFTDLIKYWVETRIK